MHTLNRVLRFLSKLERNKIYYRLSHSREDSLMIQADVPGERWEIEFMADGTIEIEIFTSDGVIRSETALTALFKKHGDPPSSTGRNGKSGTKRRKSKKASANQAL